MKRIALVIGLALLGLGLNSGTCHASWGHLFYSGYQPWWNVFAKRYKCLTPEEERLQKFWHDYYDAMKNFYKALDAVDWVAYYKNHGYQINAGCGPGGSCGRINYAPVFVAPTMQWAMPAGVAMGPPMGPPMGGGMPMGGPGMMPPPPAMGGMGPMGPMGPMPMFPMGPMGSGGMFPPTPEGPGAGGGPAGGSGPGNTPGTLPPPPGVQASSASASASSFLGR